ncbi:uncharacterized protein K02A2.6-like [Uranotaenia lowii]|uniref:uncharacterized protein K02A2.6-like n=1 Tax=Uranotaenia lowii TaxID=190385 RepID=UPI00247A4CAC|nr:uncharacterized protein K02A2.6-like [Uranotaenia lowii]
MDSSECNLTPDRPAGASGTNNGFPIGQQLQPAGMQQNFIRATQFGQQLPNPGLATQFLGQQQQQSRMQDSPATEGIFSQQSSPHQLSASDALLTQLLQQQQAFTTQMLNQQQEFMRQQQEMFIRTMSSINIQVPSNPEVILDSLSHHIREFRYEPDQNITFAAWYARYNDLFEQDASRLDSEAKVRLLLRKLGAAEHERYVNFILPRQPKDFLFENTVRKLGILFGATESLISKRYRCMQIAKKSTEDYITFSCRVNKSCVDFELGKLTEEQFKCLLFVCGLKTECDAEVRTRLLAKIEDRSDVTLEQLSEDCQRLLCLKKDTAMIEGTSGSAVQFVKRSNHRQQNSQTPPKRTVKSKSVNKNIPPSPCWKCGAMHYTRECPYKDHKCSDCGKSGHREGYCATSKSEKPYRKRKTNTFRARTLSVNTVQRKRRFVQAKLNSAEVKLQLDTGSDISVVSKSVWEKIGKPSTTPALEKASTASGAPLQLLFKFDCDVSVNGQHRRGTFYVVDKALNLLGIDLLDSFGFWSVPISSFCNQITKPSTSLESLKAAYPTVFRSALGLCSKTKVKLELKPDVQPAFRPKRPVAYAMLGTVDDELDRLERAGIISPVDFSNWAAPIVVVRKSNGSIRICGDYSTGLNEALQPHQYPLPLPEDIFTKLSNCTVFSQIDLSDAFLQVEVDEDSRNLLTINTHRGLYRYNRLSPGIKTAPGAFQQLIDTMTAGLSCTSGYLDDVVVGGETEEEHLANLEALFKRIRDFGFTLRPEKCTFVQPQIKYLGYLLDRHGLRPDPAKVQAINEMPAPVDVSGVRSFLGAMNYYGKFVPNMRTLRFPLDELLKAGAKFNWTPACQESFTKFKEILTSNLLLTHYNPRLDIVVSADASSVGVGATISHRFPDGSVKVIQHAARALTPAEKNYSQPDREGLAIIFATTKFHKMIFGRHFLLKTDHAPLLRIFGSKKGIPVYTSNRLQRWALMLLLYDFSIEHVPTAKFGDADVLSRLIKHHTKPDEDYVIASLVLEDHLRSVASDSLNALPLTFSDIQQATQTDLVMKKVYRFLQDGWPDPKALSIPELKRFYDRRESLTIVDGCILFGERLAIPVPFRKRCLDQLHRGHPGTQRMKAIARSYVYWPNVDNEISSYVQACRHCALTAKSPPHSAPSLWPKSTKPWERVHIDYAGPIEGDYFLLVIDSFTKWPEIVRTSSTTSTATINILRDLFARFGMPTTLHLTTAPFHPQSNGQAERFVDTFKRAIRKIREGRSSVPISEALCTFLLTYRSTPNPATPEGKSPSEAMFCRPIRTSLDLLRPPVHSENPPAELNRSFQNHDPVYAKVFSRNQWHWTPGTIVERIGNVMFNVRLENGKLVRSHLNQLRNRTPSGPTNSPKPSQLPLTILLDAWNLPEPSTRASTSAQSSPPSTAHGRSASQPTSTPNTVVREPRQSPDIPPMSPLPSTSSTTSPSSSSDTVEFQSAIEQTAVHLPRRSSRTRRPPIRFDPYQLY